MAATDPHAPLPADFARAVASLRDVRPRAEIRLAEAPAPHRLAPFAVALTADVVIDRAASTGNAPSAPSALSGSSTEGDDDLATGRFVVLHDPAGQEAWQGCTRIVAYVRAELEQELAADPFLAGVAWTWLTEALARHADSAVRALGGTVTKIASESFGTMIARAPVAHVEIRVSWTPADDDLGAHLSAWTDVLAAAAGLAPLPPGVSALPSRRR